MTRKTATPVSYTNRKGRTYYLHSAVKKSGKTVYVMKLSAQDALTELPEGYVITEGINGEVSVGLPKPAQITEFELAQVAAELARLGLKHYRSAAKGAHITIYEPLHSETDLREVFSLLGGPLSEQFESWTSHTLSSEPLEPIMRFQLVDKDQRLFAVERMKFSGEGGWRSLCHVETLPELARKYLPHLGKESFFELI